MRGLRIVRLVAVSITALAAASCLVAYKHASGPDPLDEDRIEKITPGVTQRPALLGAFGPPDRVVRREGSQPLAGEDAAAVELFVGRSREIAGRCVYVYQSATASEVGGVVLLAAASSRSSSRRRLWVLVNDATGIVEDVVFREE